MRETVLGAQAHLTDGAVKVCSLFPSLPLPLVALCGTLEVARMFCMLIVGDELPGEGTHAGFGAQAQPARNLAIPSRQERRCWLAGGVRSIGPEFGDLGQRLVRVGVRLLLTVLAAQEHGLVLDHHFDRHSH